MNHNRLSVLGESLVEYLICIEMKFMFSLRPDKSQIDKLPGENKLYRSPSLSILSPSASLTQPIRYSYRNYGSGTFDQSTKHPIWPRVKCLLIVIAIFYSIFSWI